MVIQITEIEKKIHKNVLTCFNCLWLNHNINSIMRTYANHINQRVIEPYFFMIISILKPESLLHVYPVN